MYILYQMMQALFIVFNSFQGLFIFLLYCVFKSTIREQWRLKCCEGRRDTTSSAPFSSISQQPSSVITNVHSGVQEEDDASDNGEDDQCSIEFNNPTYTAEPSSDDEKYDTKLLDEP